MTTAQLAILFAVLAAICTAASTVFGRLATQDAVAGANARTEQVRLQAEKLRAENLVLEQSIAPRRWFGPFAGSHLGAATGEALFKLLELNGELAKFPKTTVLIQSIPDFEASKLATHIGAGLTAVGWSPADLSRTQSGIPDLAIPDGVQIWTSAAKDRAWDAAEALAKSFSAEGIQAETPTAELHRYDPALTAFRDGDIRKAPPKDTVVILIGPKPGFYAASEKAAEAYRAANPNEK